jgi:hypothetical protein
MRTPHIIFELLTRVSLGKIRVLEGVGDGLDLRNEGIMVLITLGQNFEGLPLMLGCLKG